jgi:hypothetical protein
MYHVAFQDNLKKKKHTMCSEQFRLTTEEHITKKSCVHNNIKPQIGHFFHHRNKVWALNHNK